MAPKTLTYTNPVYPDYFADPFVLRVGRDYYAYGTAPADPDDRQFPVLHSTDLVHWRYLRHALSALTSPKAYSYWAPEVAIRDGRFYLYYSATTTPSDEHHRLRVAVADAPEGPFEDTGGLVLPDAGFTIDAHPFRDPADGRWYLFYATDYTDDPPTGTGLAVVPLADDMRSAAGQPRAILRASADWQIYERNRNYKGKTWDKWHCIEGPFVLKHPTTAEYVLLYSGGAWYTENYGLGFATAPRPLGPYTDTAAPHGPSVLKGTPSKVVGPGHNSVVLGPDDQTLFVVYHAWDTAHTGRRMCIDPLEWTPTGPRCAGPTSAPQTIRLAR